ncbi:MAG: hypothetical protein Q9M94_00565 [Candidatus Gracilibacteria bacterium]|nr:hypothetical protein [Candidatus Gracilibacteria bacterium]
MTKILEVKEIDIKNTSVFNFIEILNSKGLIKKYYDEIPNVEVEYFTEKEENKILQTEEYINLSKLIDKTF